MSLARDTDPDVRRGKLVLVDLAGSESLKKASCSVYSRDGFSESGRLLTRAGINSRIRLTRVREQRLQRGHGRPRGKRGAQKKAGLECGKETCIWLPICGVLQAIGINKVLTHLGAVVNNLNAGSWDGGGGEQRSGWAVAL